MKIVPGSVVKDNHEDVWESAIVSHNNKHLEFTFTFYGKLKEGTRMFRDFNNYLGWFEEVNPRGAQQLFEIFEKVHSVMGIFFPTEETHSKIHGLVRELMQIVTLESVQLWSRFDKNIVNPDIAEEKGANYNPEQTYNRREYDELVNQTIVLKPMVLIWGSYGAREKKLPTGAVEEKFLSLLRATQIEESEPYKRFKVFVDTVTSGKLTLAGVLDGFSTTTLPRKCFACAIVNKLAIIDLTWESDLEGVGNQVVSIVANTHRYLNTVIDSINKGEVQTSTKIFKDKQSGEEDNTSIAENYTVKEDIAEVSKIFFDYFSKSAKFMAKRAKPDIDLDFVARLVRHNTGRAQFTPTEVQYKFTSIIMAKVIGVRSLPYTNRRGALNSFSIAQLIAFELGFPNIAALLGASLFLDQDRMEIERNTKVLKCQIRNQQIEALNQYYPNKKKVKGSRSPYKNPAEIGIEALAGRFAKYVWDISVPEEIRKAMTLEPHSSGGWCVRDDLRTELADFIIAINEHIYK
ncbi:hypothetical protein ITP31_003993 [Salmonella enterica]|nr:hypothetical protein [Salmonella enterica]